MEHLCWKNGMFNLDYFIMPRLCHVCLFALHVWKKGFNCNLKYYRLKELSNFYSVKIVVLIGGAKIDFLYNGLY